MFDVAMAGEVLCMHIADPRAPEAGPVLQHAKQMAQWAAQGSAATGTKGVIVTDPQDEFSDAVALQGGWAQYYFVLVRVQGGPLDGMQALGTGSNKAVRERVAHLALAIAIYARDGLPACVDDWYPGTRERLSIALSHLTNQPAFVDAYGRWPQETTLATDSAYRSLDLRAYVLEFQRLIALEWDAAAGERDVEGRLVLETALTRGQVIVGASVSATVSNQGYTVRWDTGSASKLRVGEKIRASRTDPSEDGHKHSALIVDRVSAQNILMLSSTWNAPEDIEEGTWRFDLDVDSTSYDRMWGAVEALARKSECALQTLVCEDPGARHLREEANSRQPLCEVPCPAACTKLNDSQMEAFRQALCHHITLIQGPPGTVNLLGVSRTRWRMSATPTGGMIRPQARMIGISRARWRISATLTGGMAILGHRLKSSLAG
jgi:hypothetical protein